MSNRVVIVVQARMSSTRLPGKVLRPLAGAPSIVRLMERLAAVDGVAEALVATSVDGSDDVLAEACRTHGLRCERGSLHDVLDRYVAAAGAARADVVVRCTGDCPLIDPAVVAQVRAAAEGRSRVLVLLDSNHTHDHVLAELEAYAPLVTVGSYCVVFDTVVEHMPKEMFPDRPWGPGDNPKTAVHAWLRGHPEFEIRRQVADKLQLTVAPDGYLRRVR